MIKLCWLAMAALCCFVSTAWASADDQARVEEERLLGSADDQTPPKNDLPFTRRLRVTGAIDGTLEQSAARAGLPATAVLEMVRAFAAVLDLDEDLMNGDSFTVSYRQEYTLDGHPIGTAQVMSATLGTAARGTLSVHRFRAGRARQEQLWLATGEAAAPASLRWPLDEINVSSGFGLRSDPIAAARTVVASAKTKNKNKTATGGPVRPGPIVRRALIMHQGVDFAAESGTPIHAAAAGTVTGARPNGGYGNWIEISHDDGLKTVYGHLSAFAPDLIRRRLGGTRPAHRLRRHHRPLDRPAPALRAAAQRGADQSRRPSGNQAPADARR
jgi:murein DD-endopeptidase MepM/ murein hydrolase activator NlpD